MNKVYGIYDVERDYLIQSFRNCTGNVKSAIYSSIGNATRGIDTMSNYYDSRAKETIHINNEKRESLIVVRIGIMDENNVDWEN